MSTKISLKVSFENDVRRLSLYEPTYTILQKTLCKLFRINEEEFVNIQVKYKDDENDIITISSDNELQEAISLTNNTSPTILRLFLVPNPPPKVQKPSPPQSNTCGGYSHRWFWKKLNSLFNVGTKESLEEARTLLQKQLTMTPNYPRHLYNLACVEALLGNLEHALDFLEKAIHAGWNDLSHMEKDTDLDSLRHFDKYKELVSFLQKSPPQPQKNNTCKGFYQWHSLQKNINNLFDIGTPESLEAAKPLLLHQLSIVPTHPVPIYNLACVEALLGNLDSALKFLEEAIQAGYRDVGHIEKDKDLDGLRHLEKYKVLVESLKPPKPAVVNPCHVSPFAQPWGEHLKTLQEMGLTDQNKNKLVLEMTQGDLAAAIQLLLGEFNDSF